MRQLDAGANVATIKIDTSAPYMKHMLANSFAEALSQLPKEKVVHCWAPLQESWDNRIELHTEASKDLARLFPNHAVDMGPTATEAEPEPTVDPTASDDVDTDETDTNKRCPCAAELPGRSAGSHSASAVHSGRCIAHRWCWLSAGAGPSAGPP